MGKHALGYAHVRFDASQVIGKGTMMSRKTMFEIASSKENFSANVESIDQLFSREGIVLYADGVYREANMRQSIEQFVSDNLLLEWPYRGGCATTRLLREKLGIPKFAGSIACSESTTVLYLEYVSNMLHLFITWADNEGAYGDIDETKLSALRGDLAQAIDKLGFEREERGDQVLLLERNAAAKVVLADEPDASVADAITDFLHWSNRSDIGAKKTGLVALARDFEGIKPILATRDASALAKDFDFLVNNLDVRHNNKAGRNASEALANMSNEELLAWLDRVFGLYLEAKLAMKRYGFDEDMRQLKASLRER